MKIFDFKPLIEVLPVKHHSFTIKKKNWKLASINPFVDHMFIEDNEVTISRAELLANYMNLDTFIIKVLMWGYPTKGMGNNIETLLEPDNFDMLIAELERLRRLKSIQLIDIHKNGIKGMGWSTFSKFLYFLQLKIGDNRALIFDRRVISALKRFEDDEIKDIQGINYPPRTKDYFAYLQAMNHLADKMGVDADKIEMFLYQFGANLSEPKGEDGEID